MFSSSAPFYERIKSSSKCKQSKLILALDPQYGRNNLLEYILNLIANMGDYLCALKLNFHAILPLSISELQKISESAHKRELQMIADIKLNDIYDTNKVAIQYLNLMGFDAVIVNPFIGSKALKSTVTFAHSLNFGVISLVFMSHEGAEEGYGASVIKHFYNLEKIKQMPFYEIFYQNSKECGVDGVVVGGNRIDILKDLSKKSDNLPIYSPGIITQGGDIKTSIESGSDFLIIGRAILNNPDPLKTVQDIYSSIKSYTA